MLYRLATVVSAGILIGMLGVPHGAPSLADNARPMAAANGIVKVKSAHNFADTIARLKADIAAKGITFFAEIEQSKLAAAVGNKIGPSTLLIFGNPVLGTQFMSRSQESGIDWPVRILVFQDPSGAVWAQYTDFVWIARRHGIVSDDAPFKTANGVVASITSSVTK